MRALRHAAGQVATGLLALVVGLLIVAVIAVGALLGRLSSGPMNVTWAVPKAAALFAPGVTVGRLTLALTGTGAGRALQVVAQDAQAPGGTALHRAQFDLPLTGLLEARLVVADALVDGLRLQITLPQQGTAGSGDPAKLLAPLRHLRLTDAQAVIVFGGQSATVQVPSADLTRGADGVLRGQAAADAASGGLTVHADAQGSYGPDGAQLTLAIPAIDPAALARAVPSLAPAAALDTSFALKATAAFGPRFALRMASLHAEAGPGTVYLPAKGGGTSPGHFAALSLDADGNLSHATVRSLRIVVQPPSGNPPTTVQASATADRADGRFTAHVTLDLDRLILTDLGSVWPERVGGGSRPWLTENLGGLAHDGHITFTLTGTDSGDDIDVPEASGTAIGDDVTLWWLRPVPPITHAHAVLVWQNPDVLSITATGARQGAILEKSASMRITGLAGKDQVGFIDSDLAGPLSDVLGVLKNPRLKLLSKRPLSFTDPSGSVTAHLSVRMPLEAKVTIERIAIHATGQVANTHLGNVAADRDVDDGTFTFDVDNSGMTIGGPAKFDQIPAQISAKLDFTDGPPTQVLEQVTAGLHLTKDDAARAGLGVIGLDGGVVTAQIDYAERRNSTSTVQFQADLTPARFVTSIGWSKVAGTPGHAEIRAELDHGRLTGLEAARAEAPGLLVVGRGDIVAGRPAVIHIERGEIGRTSATGRIDLPAREGEPYRVRLSGPRLDLEAPIKEAREAPSATPERDEPARGGTPYAVDLRFDRVILGPGRELAAVGLSASGSGRRLAVAKLNTGAPELIRAELLAVPAGRRLNVSAADLGALLRATDLASEIEGGALHLEGTFEDRQAEHPFDGTLALTNFKVRGAPFAGKLLQAATLYGIVEALQGPGLLFDRAVLPMRLQGSVLTLSGARAFSTSLGLTASGRLNFARKTLDITGTIVPAYFFNALPGRIPLIGELFSPQKGGGVFAANYSIDGKLADPDVSLNPLSALAPGVLRSFFDLF